MRRLIAFIIVVIIFASSLVSTIPTYADDDDEKDTSPPSKPKPDDGVSGWSDNNEPTFKWAKSSDKGSGVAGYYWKVDSGPDTWTSSTTVKLPKQPDGSHIFYVKAKDKAGNNGTYGSHTFQIDTTPPSGTISINQGSQFATSPAVTLTLIYSDAASGVDKVRLSNDGIWNTEQWQNPSTTKTWTLSAGDGTKTVYYQLRDNVGLVSSTSDTIVLRTSGPEGSISINGDATYATTSVVSLALTYSDDASQVRYSNDGVWDTEQWETPLQSKTWSLTAGDENKIAYYQIKNDAGMISPTFSDTIILDTKSPTGSINIAGGAASTNTTTVSLTLTSSDATSGVSQMRLSNDGMFDTEQWENSAASKSWTILAGDGTKTVYVQFRDNAGLVSTTYSDTISLDTSMPSIPNPDDGVTGWNKDNTPTYTWSASIDAGSGVAGYYWRVDSGAETWIALTTITLPIQSDGRHTFFVKARDTAGNNGTYGSHVFQIDTTSPSTPSPDDGISGWSNGSKPTFSWSSSSDTESGISGYYWRVDNGPEAWITQTSVTLPVQSTGTHTFFIKAMDSAGNNGTYGSHVFQIDTTPPSVDISSPAEEEKITSPTVNVAWSGSDSGSGLDKYEVKLDSGVWIDEGIATAHIFDGVSVGLHIVYVRATDKAGQSREYQRSLYVQSQEQAASPTFGPAGGTYSITQSVSITCSTNGSIIRYTTDGSEPSSSSPIYSSPVSVNSGTVTIKARAFKTGLLDSNTVIMIYTISPPPTDQVATPTLSPPGGTYEKPQFITIQCATNDATIRYTTTGDEPTSSSMIYTTPIEAAGKITIKAKAFKSGMTDSVTASAIYKIQLQDHVPPTLSVVLNSQSNVFTIVVDDNADGSGIASVTLFIDWNVVQTWRTNGTYTYSGGTFVEGRHTYYVEVLDNSNNKARDPTAGLREFNVSPEQVQTATNQPIELYWVLTFASLIALCTACFLLMREKKK